jgi:hypothetical protein
MLNMFRQILGLSYSLLAETYSGAFSGVAELHNELFSDASRIEEWLRKKRMGLRYYAGATNTVVGMYDGIFSDASTGATTLNLDADRCLDLGGGFNTSEIERLTGQSFYSADIIAPDMRLSDPDIVLQKNSRNGTRSILRDNEHQAYIKRQSAIGYLPFDVLLDSFPDEAQSYLIISAGFITSTVRPNLTSHQMIPSQELGHVALSIHGVMRVMELVQKGKDVDFFTIQRATRRHYKYKTCLLRWRSGKLTELLTTDDIQEKYTAPQNVPYIYSVIQPSMPEFTSYLR